MFKTSSANIPRERMSLRKPASESFLAPAVLTRCWRSLIKKTLINRNSPRLDVYRAEELFDDERLPFLKFKPFADGQDSLQEGAEAPAVCSDREPTRKTTAFTSR